ncbi:neurturin-like [Carassius auratus]|uniref:Neurturin n=1 Tax=Carassius auratus TaxID=7957 RepID=A0A6P6QEI7_CARAU|nr:neurturin-like [Carassius auratus]XP_026131731.1 neurturin-like [Carassius auratus]XP_052424364.1 neurturin [Carassius gibelio]
MKLWKFAAIGLILCGAALPLLVLKTAPSSRAPPPPPHRRASSSSLSPSSSSFTTSNSSTVGAGGRQRRVRSADGGNSLVSEFMKMFQSFTEGELKQVIGTLVERKARRDAQKSKRTKRAKKRSKPCSLQEVEVTVRQLGLGYESEETILFHYCSGKCTTSRKNYDLALAKLKHSQLLTREQKDKARHSPCCRPTAYEEDISFLDNFNKYHTIQEFSAKACGCV